MKVVIDIGHPAHVHLFRNLYFLLIRANHEVKVFVKPLPVIIGLMEEYGISYSRNPGSGSGLFGKALKMIVNSVFLSWKLFRFTPDLTISSTPSLMQASYFLGIPSIFMDDDDDPVEPFIVKLAHPFSKVVFSPSGTIRNTKNAIFYSGNHELSYLHPLRFSPDENILTKYSLSVENTFSVVRFVELKGHHDNDEVGLSTEQKRKLISTLLNYGPVILSSENEQIDWGKGVVLIQKKSDIHSLLYYSKVFIGDSQTMSSEAAVLGTPSFRCNSFKDRITYLKTEEEYGLSFGFLPSEFEEMLISIKSIMDGRKRGSSYQLIRERFLADSIDVTAFLYWFIVKYPDSRNLIKEDTTYQKRF